MEQFSSFMIWPKLYVPIEGNVICSGCMPGDNMGQCTNRFHAWIFNFVRLIYSRPGSQFDTTNLQRTSQLTSNRHTHKKASTVATAHLCIQAIQKYQTKYSWLKDDLIKTCPHHHQTIQTIQISQRLTLPNKVTSHWLIPQLLFHASLLICFLSDYAGLQPCNSLISGAPKSVQPH